MRILKEQFYTGKNETQGGFIALELASDARVLRLANQDTIYGQGLYLWYLTEQDNDTMTTQTHYFAPVFTGHEFTPIDWNYLESFETADSLVVHIFGVPADKISEEDKQFRDDTTQQGEPNDPTREKLRDEAKTTETD